MLWHANKTTRSLKGMVLIRKERFKTIHKVNLFVEVVKLHFKFTLSNESFTSQILWNYAHIYSSSLLRIGGNISLVKAVWVLVYLLVKSFCRILSESSVVVYVLRGQLISKQHSAVFIITRYIGAYFIAKNAMQVLLISAWRTRWSSCGVWECSEGNRFPGIYGV